MTYPTLSVLMATYQRETPERLQRSLESIFNQTIAPDQLVLVVDGPIPGSQEVVISDYRQDRRIKDVEIVRLKQNVGLGPALNAGTAYCKGEWIMRMDTDDISLPERTQKQLDYIEAYPEVDIVLGWSEEFFDDRPDIRIKRTPLTHEEIVRALRIRNIITHPSVMIRAERLRAVNGYRGIFPLLEDWDLWVRLALAGARFGIIPSVLVRVLVADQTIRRGGWTYVRNENRFRLFLLQSGFIRLPQYVVGTAAYAVFRLVSPRLRKHMYRFVRDSAPRAQLG